MEHFSRSVYDLRHEGRLTEVLRDLGQRHHGYGVQAKDYSAAGQALIGALADTLAERFDQPAREA